MNPELRYLSSQGVRQPDKEEIDDENDEDLVSDESYSE